MIEKRIFEVDEDNFSLEETDGTYILNFKSVNTEYEFRFTSLGDVAKLSHYFWWMVGNFLDERDRKRKVGDG